MMAKKHFQVTKQQWSVCSRILLITCLFCAESPIGHAQTQSDSISESAVVTTVEPTLATTAIQLQPTMVPTFPAEPTPLSTTISSLAPTRVSTSVTATSSVSATDTTRLCFDQNQMQTLIITVSVLSVMLGFFVVTSILLCVAVCWLRSSTPKGRASKIEGGVETMFWVNDTHDIDATDDNDKQPELTTFNPSPDTDNTFNLPISPNKTASLQPIPVEQAIAPKKSKKKYTLKRVAPPPPKMKWRKKQTKISDDSDHYKVPAPYISPIPSRKAPLSSQANERVYDIPKRQLLQIKRWGRKQTKTTEYKEIDISKVQPPNPYAELIVKAEKTT